MSGRSPVPRPDLYFCSVASQSIWLTRLTFTSLCDELNESTRPCSAVSLARGIQCHSVISTGFDADFSAFRGQDVLLAAPAPGASTATSEAAAITSTQSTASFFIPCTSSLDGPRREPAHELLLEEQQEYHQRDHRDDRPREHDVDLVDARLLQLLQADLH